MTGTLPGAASRAVRLVLVVLLVALATGLAARPATGQEAAPPTDPPETGARGETVVLGVDVDDDVEQAVPHGGGSYTYTIAVANRGTVDASEVSMADEVPSGLSVTGVRAPGPWTCVLSSQQVARDADDQASAEPSTPGHLYCTMDALAAGTTAPPLAVDVEVGEDVSGQLDYRVQADSAESEPAEDTETTMVAAQQQPAQQQPAQQQPAQQQPAQLAVDLVDDVEDTVPHGGGSFAYTVTVSNPGPVEVTEVSVADPLPASLTVTGVTAPGRWTCVLPSEDGAGEQLYCLLDRLAAGANAPPLTIDVTVADDFSGRIENTVEADSAETDPVAATTLTTVDVQTRVLGNVLEKPTSSPAPQVLSAQDEAQPELARTGPWADHQHLLWAAALTMALGALLLRVSRPVTARR